MEKRKLKIGKKNLVAQAIKDTEKILKSQIVNDCKGNWVLKTLKKICTKR